MQYRKPSFPRSMITMMMYTMVCVKGTPAVIIRPGEAGMKVWTMGTYMDSWITFWEWRIMEVIM